MKLNLKFIKLKDRFNAFFVAKFPVMRKKQVVPKEVFSHDIGFFFSCERPLTPSGESLNTRTAVVSFLIPFQI